MLREVFEMGIKERLQREITLTVLQRQSIIIVTMLSTIGAITVWPRFLSDAMSVAWYWYLILILISGIPLFGKRTE